MNQGHEFWQNIVLSGIEKMLGDKFLASTINNEESDSLSNFFEAKQMAEQVYAELRGWGL